MERVAKVIVGCMLISLSILVFKHAHITTGGTTGLALNLVYLFKIPFEYLFLIVNLPSYVLSIKRMGWSFTVSTILSVLFVSLITGFERYLPDFIIPAWSGAVIGGGLMGIGLSILFVNRSSLAGTGVFTVYFQQRFGWNPGRLNLIFDTIIIGIGVFAVNLNDVFFSALSIAIISIIIGLAKNSIVTSYTSQPL